jgi:hypothetical protein
VTAFSETHRQIVHVSMAAFALLLRYLTWPQAAALAAGALAFNAFALALLAPGIVRSAGSAGLAPASCSIRCRSWRSCVPFAIASIWSPGLGV